jgi:hypothetical protein
MTYLFIIASYRCRCYPSKMLSFLHSEHLRWWNMLARELKKKRCVYLIPAAQRSFNPPPAGILVDSQQGNLPIFSSRKVN